MELTHKPTVEDSGRSLIKFSDPSERDEVLGPLYATEAKDGIPIFGAEKFASKNTKLFLNSTVKQALQSDTDPIVDLLASTNSKMDQTPHKASQVGISLHGDFQKVQLEARQAKGRDLKADSSASKTISSSRELHDKSHYSTRGTSKEARTELLDHVMLQRAIDGYLFNCKLNKAVAIDDEWLQDVWVWIEGQLNYS